MQHHCVLTRLGVFDRPETVFRPAALYYFPSHQSAMDFRRLANVRYSEGGCLCGAIRFRVTGAPAESVICHCKTCRKASAAPSVGWLTFERSRFEFLCGVPRRFRSSPGVERTFCPDCGTPLSYANDASPSSIDVTTVALDDASAFPPAREVWVSEKIRWEPTDPNLLQYPKGMNEGPYTEA